jgi:hypothetical protein
MPVVIHPESRNPAWGFYGTITQSRGDAIAEHAWMMARQQIVRATRCDPDEVRDFLDSRYGRHFADDVVGGLINGQMVDVAVAAAVAKWMAWRINRVASRQHGIPLGLPYLTGYVVAASSEDFGGLEDRDATPVGTLQ